MKMEESYPYSVITVPAQSSSSTTTQPERIRERVYPVFSIRKSLQSASNQRKASISDEQDVAFFSSDLREFQKLMKDVGRKGRRSARYESMRDRAELLRENLMNQYRRRRSG